MISKQNRFVKEIKTVISGKSPFWTARSKAEITLGKKGNLNDNTRDTLWA